MLRGVKGEWNTRGVHENQRAHELRPFCGKTDRQLAAHRVSDQMDRPIECLDPSRQQRSHFTERRKQHRLDCAEVAAEAEEVDGGDEVFLREGVDVPRPPSCGARQTVNENNRSSGTDTRLPQRVRREIETALP